MEKWATTLMQYFSAIGIVLVLYDYLLVELAQRVSRRKNHKDLLPPRKLRPMYIVRVAKATCVVQINRTVRSNEKHMKGRANCLTSSMPVSLPCSGNHHSQHSSLYKPRCVWSIWASGCFSLLSFCRYTLFGWISENACTTLFDTLLYPLCYFAPMVGSTFSLSGRSEHWMTIIAK